MTLRSLELFVEVAKSGKMSEAAKNLYISQPTISQAIQDLEKEYGVILFNRISKRLFITEAGQKLLTYAKSMLQIRAELNNTMHDLSIKKTIRAGATQTIGKCIMVDIVNTFEKKYQETSVFVTVENTAAIEAMLLDSSLDVALVEGDIKSSELIVKPIIPDTLTLLSSVAHPLAKLGHVKLEDLPKYPFVLREYGSGTRETFEFELRKKNLSVQTKWNCHGFDAIIEAVIANQGLTVISTRIAEPLIKSKKMSIIKIENVEMNRYFSLVYHKRKFITDALKEFLQHVNMYVESTLNMDRN